MSMLAVPCGRICCSVCTVPPPLIVRRTTLWVWIQAAQHRLELSGPVTATMVLLSTKRGLSHQPLRILAGSVRFDR